MSKECAKRLDPRRSCPSAATPPKPKSGATLAGERGWGRLPELLVRGAREVLGLALIALAVVVTVAGHRRWQDYQAALERSEPLPVTRLPAVLVTALVVLTLTTALLIVAEQWS